MYLMINVIHTDVLKFIEQIFSIKGGRHLHEIFNESIIFMSHFSIGMIDIDKKIRLRIFFLIQNGRCR